MAFSINEQIITHDQLYREMEQLKSAARGGENPPNCCERDEEFMGYAKENMIARVLLTQEADRLNIAVAEAEVEKAFDKIVEEAGGEEHYYINYNTSKEEIPAFKESMAINLRLQQVIEKVLGPKQTPDDAQLKAYYEAHLDRYMTPQQIRVSHLLKSIDHGKNPREVYAELQELQKQLREGADFAELSDAHSDRPGDGGDLGFFSRGELVEEFEAVVFSMTIGETSPIFLSPFGYHIARLVDRKEATPRLLEEIREQVIEHYREETHQQRTKEYVEALKAKATIEDVEDEPMVTQEHEHAAAADDDSTT